MEENKNNYNEALYDIVQARRLLGGFLIFVAAINVMEMVLKILVRYGYSDDAVLSSGYEAYVNMFRFAFVVAWYLICMVKMHKLIALNSVERKLLSIWGIILIPIQLINDLCAMLYTRTLEMIHAALILSAVDSDGSIYAMIYDSSHGFKYICIFLAILLGITITGEMLEKRSLLIFCLIVAILFMAAFTLFKMETLSFDSVAKFTVGINWTSMIFHMLTTIGLFAVGLYILKVANINDEDVEEN